MLSPSPISPLPYYNMMYPPMALPTPPPSPPVPRCAAPEDRLGLLLLNRLRLTSILGVGAYGVVYTAVDIHTHVMYAVKALNKFGVDPGHIKYQQREINLHSMASQHPNVVSLVSMMDSTDCTFVVLEFCPEGDLFTSITDKGNFVGNDALVKRVFCQILDAVEFLHSIGVYHRDLKPENILVTDQGMTAKLADFGLATMDYLTSDFGCGSTFYMSPECQQQNPRPMSCYASIPNDVWSLGVILVNLTCGRNPWKRASMDDPTFRAYLKDPFFLKTILPLSNEAIHVLSHIFECDPTKRITINGLRKKVLDCPRFTMNSVALSVPNNGPQQPFPVVAPQVPASIPVQPVMAPQASTTSSDYSSHSSYFSDGAASDVTSLTEDYSDVEAMSAMPSCTEFDSECEKKDAFSKPEQCQYYWDGPDLLVPTFPSVTYGPLVTTAC